MSHTQQVHLDVSKQRTFEWISFSSTKLSGETLPEYGKSACGFQDMHLRYQPRDVPATTAYHVVLHNVMGGYEPELKKETVGRSAEIAPEYSDPFVINPPLLPCPLHQTVFAVDLLSDTNTGCDQKNFLQPNRPSSTHQCSENVKPHYEKAVDPFDPFSIFNGPALQETNSVKAFIAEPFTRAIALSVDPFAAASLSSDPFPLSTTKMNLSNAGFVEPYSDPKCDKGQKADDWMSSFTPSTNEKSLLPGQQENGIHPPNNSHYRSLQTQPPFNPFLAPVCMAPSLNPYSKPNLTPNKFLVREIGQGAKQGIVPVDPFSDLTPSNNKYLGPKR